MWNDFFVGLPILATVLLFYLPFIISSKFKKRKLIQSKSYQMACLLDLEDFNGPFKDADLIRVETGMSFFYNMLSDSGLLIKSFTPEWSKQDIDLFARKHGYNLKYIDF